MFLPQNEKVSVIYAIPKKSEMDGRMLCEI